MGVFTTDRRLSSMLNRKVEFWQHGKSETANRLGQYEKTENRVCTKWANITPQTGSLLNGRTAETTLTKTTHKITIRYDKTITSDMWIMCNGVRYDIIYILDPFEDHERMEIFTEVVDVK